MVYFLGSITAITATFFMGCSSDDKEEIDCSLFDPAFPSLFIRIVDSTGVNLIGNGTLDPDNISVEGDFPGAAFRFIPANELANPDADIRKLDNSLWLFIPSRSTFRYTIHLGDIDKTINVAITTEPTRIPCGITYYTPIEGVYNNETLELSEVPPLQFYGDLEVSTP